MKEKIIDFIIEHTADLSRGDWMRDRGEGMYEV